MIQLKSIEKWFGQHQVLKDVNLSVKDNSVTALIGPSGSGKSTLLRCINLLETPQRGELRIGTERIEFNGTFEPSKQNRCRICLQTGMVFQNFQLFPHLKVIENVAIGLVVVHGWQKKDAIDRAEILLEKVGLLHKKEAWPSTLSGGQQQRVAIARALAPSPSVLLCDEPTSALDPELSIEVVEVLKQLAQDGVAMLMATHDLRLAANIAQHTVFLEEGRIVEAGSSKSLFTHPKQDRTRHFISTLTQTLPNEWD